MTHEDLLKAGFTIWETGGGCTAWGCGLPNGGFILITAQDDASHQFTPTEPVTVGFYDQDSDPIFTIDTKE